MGFACSLPDHEPNRIIVRGCKEKLKNLDDEMKKEDSILMKRIVEMYIGTDPS
jgi:hypothetical protein